jgi:hypothetical protein
VQSLSLWQPFSVGVAQAGLSGRGSALSQVTFATRWIWPSAHCS